MFYSRSLLPLTLLPLALFRNGQIELSEDLDQLQARFRTWSVTNADTPAADLPAEWIQVQELSPSSWTFTDTQHDSEKSLQKIAAIFGENALAEATTLSLRDIYLTIARQQKRKRLALKKSA